MKSLDCCINASKVYCEKSGHHRGQAFRLDVVKQYHCRDIFSGWIDLAYNTYITMKDGMNNTHSIMPVVEPEPIHISYTMDINNMCTPHSQELPVIHYANNQPIVSNNIIISQGPELLVIRSTV